MLKDEITIRELLLKYSSGRISVNLIHGEYAIEYDSSDWNEDSIYLPKHDSYMYAEKGEFEEDITYFLSVGRVCYETEYYKNLSNVLKTIGKDLEPLTETMNLYASVLGNITIPSQTIRTLEVFGKLCSALPMNTEEYTNQEKYKLAFDSNFEAQSGNINIKVEANDHTLADAA